MAERARLIEDGLKLKISVDQDDKNWRGRLLPEAPAVWRPEVGGRDARTPWKRHKLRLERQMPSSLSPCLKYPSCINLDFLNNLQTGADLA
jgi:hypothetical protein